MRADGKAMGFVAQPLDEVENRIAWLQHERFPASDMEMLAASVAVRALGDTCKHDVADAEIVEDPARFSELALAAVDQHEVWPIREFGGGFDVVVVFDDPCFKLSIWGQTRRV